MYYDASDEQKPELEKINSSSCSASSHLGWLLGPDFYPSCEMMPSLNYNYLRPSSAPVSSIYDERQGYFDVFATPSAQELSSSVPHLSSLPQLSLSILPSPHLPPASGVISTAHESANQDHIPRPPNAFMLYRSDFLKKGVIPSHVERRQQNLSRIAGECWNMLSDEDKSHWHAKAAKIHAAHYAQYPNYRFRPSPRGINKRGQKAKDKVRRSTEDTGSDRIRSLREKYTQLNGPAVAPARRRRRAHRSQKTPYDEGLFAAVNTPLPPSIPATPAASPAQMQSSLPYNTIKMSQADVPNSPNMVWDQESQGQTLSLNLSRPSSAAGSETGLSELMQDLDITPTAATFQQRSPMAVDSNNATWSSSAYIEDISSMVSYDDLLGLRQLQLPFHGINYAELAGPSPNLAYTCKEAGDNLQSFYSDLLSPANCDPFCYGRSTTESVSVDFINNGEWTMQETAGEKQRQ